MLYIEKYSDFYKSVMKNGAGGISCFDCPLVTECTKSGNEFVKCLDVMHYMATQEYAEPTFNWSSVEKGARVLVTYDNGETWHRRYFAGMSENGKPMVYYHGCDEWTSENKLNYECELDQIRLWSGEDE